MYEQAAMVKSVIRGLKPLTSPLPPHIASSSQRLGCVSAEADGVVTSSGTIRIWLLFLYHLLHPAASSLQPWHCFFIQMCLAQEKATEWVARGWKVTEQNRYEMSCCMSYFSQFHWASCINTHRITFLLRNKCRQKNLSGPPQWQVSHLTNHIIHLSLICVYDMSKIRWTNETFDRHK